MSAIAWMIQRQRQTLYVIIYMLDHTRVQAAAYRKYTCLIYWWFVSRTLSVNLSQAIYNRVDSMQFIAEFTCWQWTTKSGLTRLRRHWTWQCSTQCTHLLNVYGHSNPRVLKVYGWVAASLMLWLMQKRSCKPLCLFIEIMDILNSITDTVCRWGNSGGTERKGSISHIYVIAMYFNCIKLEPDARSSSSPSYVLACGSASRGSSRKLIEESIMKTPSSQLPHVSQWASTTHLFHIRWSI